MSKSKKKFKDHVSEGFKSGWKHIDASLINSGATLETDVVIVGSGAGGGNTAEILAQAGLDVIIVEEGPLKTSNDFNISKNNINRVIHIITSVRNIRAELNISYKIKINLILNIKDSSIKQFVKNWRSNG